MAEYSLTFDHLLKNRRVDASYRLIEGWLGAEGAKVKQARPPNFIEATHGRALQPMGWRKDARKKIAFELYQQGDDTHVMVRITPAFANAADVRMREDEARVNWGELLAELWMKFGEMRAKQEAEASLHIDWNWRLKNGKNAMLGGVLILLAGIVVAALFIRATYLYTGVITAGVLMFIYGAMDYRSAKKHLRSQGRSPTSLSPPK